MGEKSSLAEAPKPPTSKELLSLTAGAVVFFSIHNFLQEAIMKRPGFTFGWALGLLEMIGTCSFSAAERWLRRDAEGFPLPNRSRRRPRSASPDRRKA